MIFNGTTLKMLSTEKNNEGKRRTVGEHVNALGRRWEIIEIQPGDGCLPGGSGTAYLILRPRE
jgi:hypothetical protein